MQFNESFRKGWESLNTVTIFDDGDTDSKNTNSTQLIGHCLVNILQTNASTPVSLLIEALVQQLCAMLEQDPSRAKILYSVICEKLHEMNLIDETYTMGEFEVMRSQYQRALYQLVSAARGTITDLPIQIQKVWPLAHPDSLDWSRYHREFDEKELIARGGFGHVFKATNKLDGTDYAVKKVFLHASTISNILVHLSEVKTLASLNHANVVPYKSAWLEPLFGKSIGKSIQSNEETSSDESNSVDYNSNELDYNNSEGSSDSIQFKHPDDKVPEKAQTSNNVDKSRLDTDENAVCMYQNKNINLRDVPHLSLNWAILYIQMSLCQLTLRQWLDLRNQGDFETFYNQYTPQCCCCHLNEQHTKKNTSNIDDAKLELQATTIRVNSDIEHPELKTSDGHLNAIDSKHIHRDKAQEPNLLPVHENNTSPLHLAQSISKEPDHPLHLESNENCFHTIHTKIVIDIMTQVTEGLNYIHSRGIVHHDIKPSNIFIGVDRGVLSVQLGDFGLACPLNNAHSGVGLGTPLYAAPEQVKGECNSKSDIYSLGIILLELLVGFNTDMERVKTITELRRTGHIPNEVIASYPRLSQLIQKLVSHKVKRRPNTKELLESLEHISNNQKIEEGKEQEIASLKKEIAVMKEEIESKDLEIERLKSVIESLNQ